MATINLEKYTINKKSSNRVFVRPVQGQSIAECMVKKSGDATLSRVATIKRTNFKLNKIRSVLETIDGVKIPRAKIKQIVEIIDQ